MATNAQWIFETTMSMIDELDDDGAADTDDTEEYKNRTLAILNVIAGELYPYSDTYEEDEENFVRPIVAPIEDFYTDIHLDDYICRSIMPYGLAAHLLLDENPTSANYFQQRYDELKQKLSVGLPTVSIDVEDVYSSHPKFSNGIGFEWTTRW